MKTSVIIPCWVNDEETLTVTANAVESFVGFGEPHPDLELILIDNASAVGSGWMRSKADIYIRYPENRGFTVAINDGIKIANGEMIAWANNDIRVPANWIKVCQGIEADTIHPKMINYDDPFVFGDTVKEDERLCQNSFVVTRHHDLFFDEAYGIGGGADDWDFAMKMHELGLRRVYTDKTAFQHLHSFSLKKLGPERQKIVDQNNVLFKSKWGMEKEKLFKERGLI